MSLVGYKSAFYMIFHSGASHQMQNLSKNGGVSQSGSPLIS